MAAAERRHPGVADAVVKDPVDLSQLHLTPGVRQVGRFGLHAAPELAARAH